MAIGVLKVHPARAKAAWETARQWCADPLSHLVRLPARIGFGARSKCYTIPVSQTIDQEVLSPGVRKNAIADLLLYRPLADACCASDFCLQR